MRVLVACEFSGIVRDAFIARGHDAWSCDLLPTEKPVIENGVSTRHWMGDVTKIIGNNEWDLMIAHPPCDYITNSGVQWLHRLPKKPKPHILYGPARWKALDDACAFFRALLGANVKRIAVENPIPHKYAIERIGCDYDQLIQPYNFGHGEMKATCLWLKNLPPLTATAPVGGREQRVFRESPGPERKKNRSRTFQGIADAMANQWG